jgi:hypothetical protein
LAVAGYGAWAAWFPGGWLVGLVLCTGCASRATLLTDAFPPGSSARPWVLREPAWSGSFDSAAPALGDEAGDWAALGARQVWLAIYQHEQDARARLTARVFSFESAEAAREAYRRFQPLPASGFRAGDEGCWTDVGVMFVWGKLLVDVFTSDPSTKASPEQAAFLVGLMERRMHPRLASEPQ